MTKAASGITILLLLLLPLACDRIASSGPNPPSLFFPVFASPTRTFTSTPTSTKTPVNTPTPALTTTCSFMPVTQWGGIGVGNGQFQGPSDAASDAATNLYVLDAANQRVQVFDALGNYLTQWNGSNSLFVPVHLALNPALARVYILDTNNSVPPQGVMRVMDTDGTTRPTWPIPLNASGLAIDSQGRVYVGTQGSVIRYDQNGFSPYYFYSQGVTGVSFNGVQGVAVDNSGNLFVADSSSIQKFNPSAQFVSKWGMPGSAPAQFTGILYIRTDTSGNVFAADNPVIGGVPYGRIQKFDNNGNLICYYQLGSSQFQAIAFDPAGGLYLVDGLNSLIRKFIP